MTEPTEFALLEVATFYALHAVSDAERADIEQQVGAAPQSVAEAFHQEVLAVHETMALVSVVTAAEPPSQLRSVVLAGLGHVEHGTSGGNSRWRTILLAAAAVIVVGLAAFGAGVALRPSAPTTVAEQVLAAPDVQTVSTALLRGGKATVMFSRQKGAGVLVLNDVPPPSPGSVYQMWLIDTHGPTSAGTMNTKSVAPSTTATISGLGKSDALALSVEPGSGSRQPTGPIFVELPLS